MVDYGACLIHPRCWLSSPAEVQAMPIVNPISQILCHFLQNFWRLVRYESRSAWRWCHSACSNFINLGSDLWCLMRRRANVLGIRPPFVVCNFNSDQASEGLLLARTVDGRELGSNSNNWGRNWIPRNCTRAAGSSFHGLNIIIVTPRCALHRFWIPTR